MKFPAKLFTGVLTACLGLNSLGSAAANSPSAKPRQQAPLNRVATILVSQDFINEQLKKHSKSAMVQQLNITLSPDNDIMYLRGLIQIPTEEMRAINLDPSLGKYRFQVSIAPKTTPQGHLILEFPLDQTFFYPADSKQPKKDRVIVPVQMLSVALASVRGYLAALSGDFAGFDRRTAKLDALIKSLNHAISSQKNPDAREDLINQRDSIKLQLASVPIERKQLQNLSKEFGSMLKFTGEKELSLNNELSAQKNALILKIRLSQLTPYLTGVELGGVRIIHSKRDGGGQNYLAVDVNAELAINPAPIAATPRKGGGLTSAPALIVRLNESLLSSKAVTSAEQKQLPSKLKSFEVHLKEDGIHISGSVRAFLFFSIPFDTVVDINSDETDQFEVRIRDVKIAGLDFDSLGKFALDSVRKRLDASFPGICTFQYIEDENDGSRALQVNVDPKKLVPAAPDLHLIDVDIREGELLMKIGHD